MRLAGYKCCEIRKSKQANMDCLNRSRGHLSATVADPTVSKIHRGSQRGNLLLVASCGNSVMCKICEQYVSERERERFTEIYIFIYLVHDRRVYY